MISLKRSVDQFDVLKNALDASVRSYRHILTGMERDIIPLCVEKPDELSGVLASLARALEAKPAPDFPRAERELLDLFEKLNAGATQQIRERLQDMRDILEGLARVAEKAYSRTTAYAGQFRGVAQALDSLKQCHSMSEIQSALERESHRLRDTVEQMEQDNSNQTAALIEELNECRSRLQRAEAASLSDPATGAGNRRALERELQTRIDRDEDFSLVLFEVDNFPAITARFGLLSGDAVLKQFTERLKQALRSHDEVVRWGGQQFVVLLPCSVREALSRARQIAGGLAGRYVIACDGRELRTEVSASAGVAEYRRGETVEQLMSRAEALLQHRRGE